MPKTWEEVNDLPVPDLFAAMRRLADLVKADPPPKTCPAHRDRRGYAPPHMCEGCRADLEVRSAHLDRLRDIAWYTQ